MAITTKIRITRDKLADFVKDPDTIRQLELLIDIVNSLDTSGEETLEEMITRIHIEDPS